MSAYQDIPYKCIDCGRPCVWTAKDQAFYAEKGYTNQPKRCKPCRMERKRADYESVGRTADGNA